MDLQLGIVPDGQSNANLSIDAALASLREQYAKAVFEGGAARQSVEHHFPENRLRAPREPSPAMSFALRRLQIGGELRALRHDDAEIWVAPSLHDGRVSHLKGR